MGDPVFLLNPTPPPVARLDLVIEIPQRLVMDWRRQIGHRKKHRGRHRNDNQQRILEWNLRMALLEISSHHRAADHRGELRPGVDSPPEPAQDPYNPGAAGKR